ncbi:hypothetical protein DFH09DRAFT_1082783 [Mycena vulgaris]|nr:hypothetical protein DFH09DRAFT_1082783 [Mycena vulgaris]
MLAALQSTTRYYRAANPNPREHYRALHGTTEHVPHYTALQSSTTGYYRAGAPTTQHYTCSLADQVSTTALPHGVIRVIPIKLNPPPATRTHTTSRLRMTHVNRGVRSGRSALQRAHTNGLPMSAEVAPGFGSKMPSRRQVGDQVRSRIGPTLNNTNHNEHITGIWSLVEAMGYPGANIFVPVEERILFSSAKPFPVPSGDPGSKRLFRLMMDFLGQGSTLDEDLNSSLLIPCLEEMQPGPGESFRNELLQVLDNLSKLSSPQPSGKRDATHIELDRALSKTIDSLVRRTTAHHGHIRRSVEHILPLAETTVQIGSRLLAGIESEILRTREVL